MVAILARWGVSQGTVSLYSSPEGWKGTFWDGKEVTPIEVNGIPRGKKIHNFDEIFYPLLRRDLSGRVTRAELHVRGLGGCFWRWLCCFSTQNQEEGKPLLAERRPSSSDIPDHLKERRRPRVVREQSPTSQHHLPLTPQTLVDVWNDPMTSQEDSQALVRRALTTVQTCPFNQTQQLFPLLQIPHRALTGRILEKCIQPIRDETIISLSMIQNLEMVLERMRFGLISVDDLVQILNVLKDRLQKTHWGDIPKAVIELQAVVCLLNIMTDLDVQGMGRVRVHQPVFELLDRVAEQGNIELLVWASYAKQALARISSDETLLRCVLRKEGRALQGIFNLAGFVRTLQPDQLTKACEALKEACQRQDKRKYWYEQLRFCEWLLKMGRIEEFERYLFSDLQGTPHKKLAFPLIAYLDRVVQTHPSREMKVKTLKILTAIYLNSEKWIFKESVKHRAFGRENYSDLFKTHLVAMHVAYRQLPELEQEAQEGLENMQKCRFFCSTNQVHPLLWTNRDSSAEAPPLEIGREGGHPMESCIEAIRKETYGDEVFQENSMFYIPVSGTRDVHAAVTYDLSEEVTRFLSSRGKVLLILGNAGSGKSLFCQTMAAELGQKYRAGGVILLFISLPSLRDPIRRAIPEFLESFGFTSEQVEEARQKREFVFFLDGFDEINQLQNLYMTNQLHRWNCHVIISCRTQYLTSVSDYLSFFFPYHQEEPQKHLFLETSIAPFSPAQRSQFLQKYLSKVETPWKDYQLYEREIDRIPGLSGLTKNPFILKITADVLPDIVIKHQNERPSEILRVGEIDLYDAFTWHWFERQKAKLIANGCQADLGTIIQDFREFSSKLAKKMTEKGVTQVTYVERSDLFSPGPLSEWEMFFGQTNPRIAIARTGAPLRKFGPNQWGFLHDTLRSYFYSKNITT